MQSYAEPRVHFWNRNEYYKMAEAGLFDGVHVELIEGQVMEMSPIGSLHVTATGLAGEVLKSAFGPGYFVREQAPLDAGELSEPQPDVAIIQGDRRQFKNAHPKMAVLIVEIAETSLAYDRTEKASLYAKIGIPDYWILNLPRRRLEVCRQPVRNESSPFGFAYADLKVLAEGDSVSPLLRPDVQISVASLLP
ncbi:MAG TPA: Uma2 family endonuclease [Blastocatellia bacterium]|nr:Uma2 family endonuclease [Blastocatellia bacterium]